MSTAVVYSRLRVTDPGRWRAVARDWRHWAALAGDLVAGLTADLARLGQVWSGAAATAATGALSRLRRRLVLFRVLCWQADQAASEFAAALERARRLLAAARASASRSGLTIDDLGNIRDGPANTGPAPTGTTTPTRSAPTGSASGLPGISGSPSLGSSSGTGSHPSTGSFPGTGSHPSTGSGDADGSSRATGLRAESEASGASVVRWQVDRHSAEAEAEAEAVATELAAALALAAQADEAASARLAEIASVAQARPGLAQPGSALPGTPEPDCTAAPAAFAALVGRPGAGRPLVAARR